MIWISLSPATGRANWTTSTSSRFMRARPLISSIVEASGVAPTIPRTSEISFCGKVSWCLKFE